MSEAPVNTSGQPVRIMMVGGGSGGHLTPLLALAVEIKQRHPETRVTVVSQKRENLQEVVSHASIDETYSISAGKFRRYHGESLLAHLKDVKTIALNIRDFFRFMRGIAEAWRLLGKERPTVILLKGGFVSVPVGIAARFRKITYVTHDSDAVPGLANRIVAKRATYNLTAMPATMYPYNQAKTLQVGVPLRPEFTFVTPDQQTAFRLKLGIPGSAQVLCCIGGGLGAQKLNHALAHISLDLLTMYPDLIILHVAGQKLYTETMQLYQRQLPQASLERVKVFDFYNNFFELSGAADIVVSRAGATSIAELAVQGKPSIIVPGAQLTGGQQLHNARALQQAEAAIIVDENNTDELMRAVQGLLGSAEERAGYSAKFHALAFEQSTQKIVSVLFELANPTPEGNSISASAKTQEK